MKKIDRATPDYIKKIWPRKRTPLRAIREMCWSCTCGQRNAIRDCPSTDCPIWPFRMGKNPYVQISVEGLEAKRQRAAEMNAARRKKKKGHNR
jgi:hypothetical protein